MFIWDWFSGVLNYLGLWKKSGKLLFLGKTDLSNTLFLLYTDWICRIGQCREDNTASHVER